MPPLPRIRVLLAVGGVALGSAILPPLAPQGFPLWGLAGIGAAVVATLLVTRPLLCLIALAITEVAHVGEVAAGWGVPGVSTAMLVLAVAAAGVGLARGKLRLTWSPLYLAAAVFLGSRALSVAVAQDPAAAFDSVMETARSLVLLITVVTLASAVNAASWALAAATLTAAGLAGLSVVQEFALDNAWDFAGFSNVPKVADAGSFTARHAGPLPDANFWARALVLFVPIALCFLVSRLPPAARFPKLGRMAGWRPIWLAAGFTLMIGIYLTGSRGGLISAAFAGACWLLLAGPRYRRMLLFAPVLVVLTLFLPGVGSRLGTLTQVGAAQVEEGDPSLVGRFNVMQQGLAMFADHPATGVGAGNFETVIPEYQRRSGRLTHLPTAPHNIYLQMATEGGLGGLATWLLFYGTAMFVAIRSLLRQAARTGQDDCAECLLAAAIFASLVGWALASLFLHLSDFRVLLLVVGIGAALDANANAAARGSEPTGFSPPLSEQEGSEPTFPRVRSAKQAGVPIAAAILSALAVVVGGLGLFPLETHLWISQRQLYVEPSNAAVSGYDAYAHDVARRSVGPTFAAILGDRRFQMRAEEQAELSPDQRSGLQVAAQNSSLSGILTLTVTSRHPHVAAPVATAIVAEGTEFVRSLDRLYVLVPVEGTSREVRQSQLEGARLAALLLSGIASAVVAHRLVASVLRGPRGPSARESASRWLPAGRRGGRRWLTAE